MTKPLWAIVLYEDDGITEKNVVYLSNNRDRELFLDPICSKQDFKRRSEKRFTSHYLLFDALRCADFLRYMDRVRAKGKP